MCNSSNPSIWGVALSWKNNPQGSGVSFLTFLEYINSAPEKTLSSSLVISPLLYLVKTIWSLLVVIALWILEYTNSAPEKTLSSSLVISAAAFVVSAAAFIVSAAE